MRILALLPALLLAGAPALAHEGEDHGDAPHPVATTQATPRFEAESEDFELVGVLEGKALTLYLDRRATNEPVADAKIEVESAAFKGVATQVSPAVYRLPVDRLVAPGKYPIAITVQSPAGGDLLSGAVEIAPQAAPATQSGWPWGRWAIGAAVAGAMAAVAFGLFVARRSRRGKGGAA